MDFSRQPLQGSDIAAFVFAVLALLFFALWRRDRERGMGWLAVAYVVLATQYALNGATLPVNELANPLATALISIGIASFNCGTMYYLASPDNPKRGQLALGKPISIAFARGRHRRGTLSTVVLPPLCNWLVRRGEGGV